MLGWVKIRKLHARSLIAHDNVKVPQKAPDGFHKSLKTVICLAKLLCRSILKWLTALAFKQSILSPAIWENLKEYLIYKRYQRRKRKSGNWIQALDKAIGWKAVCCCRHPPDIAYVVHCNTTTSYTAEPLQKVELRITKCAVQLPVSWDTPLAAEMHTRLRLGQFEIWKRPP